MGPHHLKTLHRNHVTHKHTVIAHTGTRHRQTHGDSTYLGTQYVTLAVVLPCARWYSHSDFSEVLASVRACGKQPSFVYHR